VAEATYPAVLTEKGMAATIRTYFDACNDADVERVSACFVPAGVHYYASPQDTTLHRLELGGFDYEGRGCPMRSPITRTR
jgi:hypothetical protein